MYYCIIYLKKITICTVLHFSCFIFTICTIHDAYQYLKMRHDDTFLYLMWNNNPFYSQILCLWFPIHLLQFYLYFVDLIIYLFLLWTSKLKWILNLYVSIQHILLHLTQNWCLNFLLKGQKCLLKCVWWQCNNRIP